MPTFLSGVERANSWTERDSVLNSFKAIGSAQVKVRRTKAKAEIYWESREGREVARKRVAISALGCWLTNVNVSVLLINV